MSTKPPSGLAASSRANGSDSEENSVDAEDLSDQIQVDASDDVTVEAAEEVTMESVTTTSVAPEPTPPPLSALAESALGNSPQPVLPSFFGALSPTLPLPGVTAPSDESREIGDDITTIARGVNDDITRPAVTDDDDDEETKVEHEENVVRAAAGRDEVTTALSEQASFEREKALRKSGPSLFEGGARARDVEFEDPDGDEEIVSADPIISSADAISADPIDDDDDEIAAAAEDDDDIPDHEVRSADPDTDELDEEDRMKLVARKAARLVDDGDDDDAATFAKSPEPSPLVAALTARRPGSPPLGSSFPREGGFGTRLPSPSGGYASLALQAPAQAPAPVSSPFGRLAPVASTSPYGARATASSVAALQIPPPSGAAAAPSEGTGLFRPFTLPLGGFVAAIFGALFAGVIFGAKLFGGATQAPPITVISSRPAPPAVTAPVVQPVSPPAAANTNPGSAAAPEALPTPNLPPSGPAITPLPGSGTGTAGMGTETGESATPKPKRLLPPRRKAAPTLDDPLAPAPKPKPGKPAKPAKVWVDPFAG